jgi:hypothetical protein
MKDLRHAVAKLRSEHRVEARYCSASEVLDFNEAIGQCGKQSPSFLRKRVHPTPIRRHHGNGLTDGLQDPVLGIVDHTRSCLP